jgi:hypothetical protein
LSVLPQDHEEESMRTPLVKAVAAAAAAILLSYLSGVGPAATESCTSTNTSCWDAMAKEYRKCTVKTCTTKEGQVTTDVRIERTTPKDPAKNKLGDIARPPSNLLEDRSPGTGPQAPGSVRRGLVKDSVAPGISPSGPQIK